MRVTPEPRIDSSLEKTSSEPIPARTEKISHIEPGIHMLLTITKNDLE
jgi:hypothetical protein